MKRAILIATNRSGGTFLNYALDSHPDVGWERGEPLTALRSDPDPLGCVDRLLTEKRGYEVVGCKLSYRFVRDVIGLDALAGLNIDRVIHLYRDDAVRTILSSTINTQSRDAGWPYPAQATGPTPQARITVDVDEFVSECLRYVGNVRSMKQALMDLGLPVLSVTYANVMGGEDCNAEQVHPITAGRLCSFLDVPYTPLIARLRRVNPQPTRDIVANWDALAAALEPHQGDLYV